MKLSHGTWVMVLDGEKYLLLRNRGDADNLDLRVVEHEEIDNPPTHDQGTEQPGRKADAGLGRSAVEQTDWHALEKANFAGDVADRLKNWALKNRFRELLVCADPRTLGTIRPKYHSEVSRRLIGEIDKDLTSLPVDEIEHIVGAA